MPKEFDARTLTKMVSEVVLETFKEMCRVESGAEPVMAERDIIEFDSLMRVFPMDKFNGPAYVVSINYGLSDKDIEAGHVVGTFLLFVKEEQAEKIARAFGLTSRDMEHEDTILDKVGEMATIIAGKVKEEIAASGHPDLRMSPAVKYKNAIPQGVPFCYDLYKKQELIFTFWKEKCVAVEICLTQLPRKV